MTEPSIRGVRDEPYPRPSSLLDYEGEKDSGFALAARPRWWNVDQERPNWTAPLLGPDDASGSPSPSTPIWRPSNIPPLTIGQTGTSLKLLEDEADEEMPPSGLLPLSEYLNGMEFNARASARLGMHARGLGLLVGIGTGALDTVDDIGGMLTFLTRLPVDWLTSPPGQSAASQLADDLVNIYHYAKNSAENPQIVVQDIKDELRKLNTEANPYAIPAASTFTGEMRRDFDIGRNQGKLIFNIAPLGAGVRAIKAVKAVARAGKAMRATSTADYIAQRGGSKLAEYFATPYVGGMGHHFTPRSWKFPDKVAGVPLPRSIVGQRLPKNISDSPLNVLKPDDMTRGEFYRLHYAVDPDYFGGKIRKKFGGGGWSGEDLGWTKLDGLERIWYASPAPLKITVGGAGAGAAMLLHSARDDGRSP